MHPVRYTVPELHKEDLYSGIKEWASVLYSIDGDFTMWAKTFLAQGRSWAEEDILVAATALKSSGHICVRGLALFWARIQRSTSNPMGRTRECHYESVGAFSFLDIPDSVSREEVVRWEHALWLDPACAGAYSDWAEERGWEERVEGLRKSYLRSTP